VVFYKGSLQLPQIKNLLLSAPQVTALLKVAAVG